MNDFYDAKSGNKMKYIQTKNSASSPFQAQGHGAVPGMGGWVLREPGLPKKSGPVTAA